MITIYTAIQQDIKIAKAKIKHIAHTKHRTKQEELINMMGEKEIKGEIVGIQNLEPQQILVNIEGIESQSLGLLLGKKVRISIID